jgi:hypothetical protein
MGSKLSKLRFFLVHIDLISFSSCRTGTVFTVAHLPNSLEAFSGSVEHQMFWWV